MLHIVAWGCTWHGCWIEGNNHKYEGRNERENMFTYQYMFQFNLLWGVHLSIYFFEVVCLLVDMIGNRTTHIWVEFNKNICPPLCWLPLVKPLNFPIYYIPLGYHFYIFLNPLATTLTSLFPLMMTKMQLQLASLQNNKTSQKHLCGCQPSGHAKHRKLGLSQWSPQRRPRYSKHDFINVSSKNINEKARDPETLIKWSGQNSRSLN